MNAVELYFQNGTPVGVFYCDKCRFVYRTNGEAEQCCLPKLCDCGTELDKYWTVCKACRDRKETEEERIRFEKAEKVTDWTDWVYCDGVGYNEGYFTSVDELVQYLMDADDDEPNLATVRYCYACTSCSVLKMDADSIIEDSTQDAYEDFDEFDLEGVEEFKAAVKAFLTANVNNPRNVIWWPDNKRVILLPEPEECEAN